MDFDNFRPELLKNTHCATCAFSRHAWFSQIRSHIFIKFSAPWSAAVITTQLISTIHSSHELVVRYDALWARYFQAASISLLPVNCAMTGRLTIARHHHHDLTVHPGSCWHLSSLDSYWLHSVFMSVHNYNHCSCHVLIPIHILLSLMHTHTHTRTPIHTCTYRTYVHTLG